MITNAVINLHWYELCSISVKVLVFLFVHLIQSTWKVRKHQNKSKDLPSIASDCTVTLPIHRMIVALNTGLHPTTSTMSVYNLYVLKKMFYNLKLNTHNSTHGQISHLLCYYSSFLQGFFLWYPQNALYILQNPLGKGNSNSPVHRHRFQQSDYGQQYHSWWVTMPA